MYKTHATKQKIALIVCLVGLMYLFYQLMRPFLASLIIASILVILFYPSYERVKGKMGNKPRLAAFVVTLAIFLIILLPATTVISLVIDQAYSLVRDFDWQNSYNTVFLPIFQKLQTRFAMNVDALGMLADFGKTVGGFVSRFPPKVLFGTAGFFFDFFIMIVSLYFLFLEGPGLLRLFYALSPMRNTHEKRLLKEIQNTIHASVYGYLVTSLVQAILATLAFAVTGIPGSIVLGTLVFFMSMVPVIGATGVWLPVCIGLFVQGETGWAIANLVWGVLVVSGIDNILKPMIIQGKTRIHPLLVFFSIFGGIVWFGPIGILFGPVITATLIATIKIYKDEFV